jgi:signal transduction histidine kinase
MNLRPLHVLLIDDDEDEFVFIRDLLKDAKNSVFRLEWTKNIQEARMKMLQRSHDIYLLDYRLGEVSGLELLKEVLLQGSKAPIILLTGYDDADVDREAMNLGAADYLQKSFLTSYLLERSLRYAIYRTQMQAQAISQDRMASIGLIASSLAHEIGTPLGVIRGRAEYLGMQVKDNAAIKNNVDIITTQIDRVSGLIRSLLNLARGDVNVKIGVISVNASVTEVIELLAHDIKKQEIEVINLLDSENIIRVPGQSAKLHQVFLNLIVNAIHAIRKAKETERVSGHFIKVSCEDLGTQYAISIQDSGCGIPEAHHADLFRPFFTTKNPGEGTGLGLATSLWIVQSWAGKIESQSQEGLGSTFRIILPKGS